MKSGYIAISIGIAAAAVTITAVLLSIMMEDTTTHATNTALNTRFPISPDGIPDKPRKSDLPPAGGSLFGMLVPKQFQNFDIRGDSVFPNHTVKENVIEKYQPINITIVNFHRTIEGQNVNASNVKIQALPSKIDNSKTKINFIIHAKSIKLSTDFGFPLNKSFNNLYLDSISGVYDKDTGKMTMHIPPETLFSLMFS
jgi:uncharacterized FlaG/YvyC family protein